MWCEARKDKQVGRTESVKLRAETADDLQVFSAMLQDATVKVEDLAYLPRERRFACVVNRYRWEGASNRRHKSGERVRSGLSFSGVLRAQLQHVPMTNKEHVMELLSVSLDAGEDGAATATLTFSGYAAIRLELECVDAHLEDLTQPWAARVRPHHETTDAPHSDNPDSDSGKDAKF